MNNKTTHCGFIAIIGKPNVGKSTLLNKILGNKVSITSPKAQTTRHQIRGIKVVDQTQLVFIDTPGLHQKSKHVINKVMNKMSQQAINDDVDAILFLIEANHLTDDDKWAMKKLKNVNCPIILVVNKVDKIKNKETLLPFLKEVNEMLEFADVFPLSALKGINIEVLLEKLVSFMPESPYFFPEDQQTDRGEKFQCAELIREKTLYLLAEELPHELNVEINHLENNETICHIDATIWVEREGQKAIVIGKNGDMLKKIGSEARIDIEKLVKNKVFLKIWVKVKSGWSDDPNVIRYFGYE